MLATNVKTGKTQAETVTAVMLRRDADRYDLTIRAGHRTAVIGTTRSHLFWNLSQHRWVKAGALKYGDHLRAPGGVTVTVIGGSAPADAVGWMWDLSVPGGNDHDFYIDTAAAAVLVHNCPMEQKPAPLWKRCVLAIGAGLSILHSVATGQAPMGPRPQYETQIPWEDQTPTAEGPPVAGGEGGAGGTGGGAGEPGGGGEC